MKTCIRKECSRTYTPSDYRQKFCSRSCAASENNKKHPKQKRTSRPENCVICNEKLSPQQDYCCSRECAKSRHAIKYLHDWVEGFVDGSSENGKLRDNLRTILLETCNYTCDCGWNTPNPITGKPILTIDHIDGNWKNNFIWNLKVLCYNCHTLTPTFGSLNAGSISGRRNYKHGR